MEPENSNQEPEEDNCNQEPKEGQMADGDAEPGDTS